jgi:type II secretory pathway pseudopilin PulG
MKTKNRGFSIVEVLVTTSIIIITTSIIIILLALSFSFMKKKEIERSNRQQLTQLMSSTNKNIVLTEEGVIHRYNYFIFEDKSTKARIFYYNGSMVLLPKKEDM